ncbi:MAG: hypothetical protein LRY37_05880 [Alkalibacterium thalassium]|nr:hypothetical protein [Alkalibacterium thalassium]
MKILVWLTETTEGDLEEIGSGAHMAHAFWKYIRPSERLTPLPVFESYEFLHRRNRRLEESAIIIANHAYLLADWKKLSLFIQSGTVIIDEAHHLPDVIDQSATLFIKSQFTRQGSQADWISRQRRFHSSSAGCGSG